MSHADGAPAIPAIAHEVVGTAGRPLDQATRTTMEQGFGHDFSAVRIHAGEHADRAAQAVGALAFTMGSHVVFGAGQHDPASQTGRRLLAHELAHVVQQRGHGGMPAPQLAGIAPASSPEEAAADAAAAAVVSGRPAGPVAEVRPALYRRPAPYIKKISVHLTPDESADLTWEGTPPADATGSDSFTVSTGKGYGDPGDPPGTCSRQCCSDPAKQCAPPWNEPGRQGSCCTYKGTAFWAGKPEAVHGGAGGWEFWTPIQPYYSTRGIALHTHPEVTGKPIGHGCVRMERDNAQRIHDYSNGTSTKVAIDGTATPVLCEEARRCGAPAGTTGGGGAGGGAGARAMQGTEAPEGGAELAAAEASVVPRLEGELS